MRRTHLRGRENILKRVLIHASGLNLGLVLRKLTGVGTPRALQGLVRLLFAPWATLWRALMSSIVRPIEDLRPSTTRTAVVSPPDPRTDRVPSTTGC
jgi:transposase